MSSATEDLTIAHTRRATGIVDDANTYGTVMVTGDDQPEVVVMSVDEFARLKRTLMDNAVAKMRAEIDRQVAVMNAPGAHERWRAMMDATPQEIADAVNAAEAKQRRNASVIPLPERFRRRRKCFTCETEQSSP